MGCDIHLYVEKRVDGKWVSADEWFEDGPGTLSVYKWGPGLTRLAGPMYSDRNYDLFAMLANVRNGHGFAGVDTGNGFVPIHDQRGLPDDVSENVFKSWKDWDSDGHSTSWATVKELLEYDWTRTTKKRGWVSPKEFARWALDGRPQSWSGSVGGGGIKHLTNDEMMSEITGGAKLTWSHFRGLGKEGMFATSYTQVEWETSYAEQAGSFLNITMPKLWRLGAPEDVRIVYWFDN